MKNFRHIFLFIASLFLLFGLVNFVSAQETPEEIATAKYGISFPIAELGGCKNIGECRTYCEDPLNRDACVAFAKSKGFYKVDQLSQKQQELLNAAKTELGCTDIASCQALCHQEENFARCDSYAKKHGVDGGHVEDPAKQEIVRKAQEVLGCNSPQSCRSFCEQPDNRAKCDNFAKQVGLRGGETRHGPGGCTSEETCKAFCSDPNNYQVCKGFSQGSGGKFVGPGGCNSEATCRAYCQQNPQECGYGGPRPTGSYNPQEMCLRTPSCRWSNNACECGFYNALESGKKAEEYAIFCREHPDQCMPGQLGGFVSSGDRPQFEQYCRENPDKCRMQFERKAEVETCFRSGKYWYNNTCNDNPQTGGYPYPTGPYPTGDYRRPSPPPGGQCPEGYYIGPGGYCIPKGGGTNYTPYPQPTYTGGYTPFPTYNPQEGCLKNANCRWENNSCQCTSSTSPPQTNTAEQECKSRSGCRWENNNCICESSGGTSGTSGESPEQGCVKTAGCSWVNNTCQCSQVQGATAPQNFLESILFFFSNLFR